MNYHREFLNSTRLEKILNLPPELQNTDVEVIILPAKEKDSSKIGIKSLRGRLKKYANPDLIKHEKTAWATAVEEKYADN